MSIAIPKRYLLSQEATFRFQDSNRVFVSIKGKSISLSLEFYRALLEFSNPSTLEDVHKNFRGSVSPEELSRLFARCLDHKLLAPARERARTVAEQSFEGVLNPTAWGSQRVQKQLGTRLAGGQVCIIRKAFKPAFAEKVAAGLEAAPRWSRFEGYRPHFYFQYHTISSSSSEVLAECSRIFDNGSTKAFMQELSGTNCGGAVELNASLYLPGDHVLPHEDNSDTRSVAFVWYLTRSWDAEWGGQFYWCATGHSIMPTFNTLLLFRVSNSSSHMVCKTSPLAQGRRLSVNGWWNEEGIETRQQPGTKSKNSWYSGPDLTQVSKHVFCIGS